MKNTPRVKSEKYPHKDSSHYRSVLEQFSAHKESNRKSEFIRTHDSKKYNAIISSMLLRKDQQGSRVVQMESAQLSRGSARQGMCRY